MEFITYIDISKCLDTNVIATQPALPDLLAAEVYLLCNSKQTSENIVTLYSNKQKGLIDVTSSKPCLYSVQVLCQL